MGAIFSYSLSCGIILALCYLGYKWLMASENQHYFNRFLLYVILLSSFTLPFLYRSIQSSIGLSGSEGYGIEIGEPEIMGQVTPIDGISGEDTLFTIENLLTLLVWIYIAGIVVVLIISVAGGCQLRRIISRGEKCEAGRFTLVLSDDEGIAPFSWIRYIVMSRKDFEESGEYILIHESRHLVLRHWIDMLVCQIAIIFQWYNPAAWLIREEFRNIHEFQADAAVLHSGVNAKEYQMLLIKKTVGKSFQTLANSLNHSKLKKRVTMMYKRKSSVGRRLGAMVLLPAMALGCVVISLQAVAGVLEEASEVSLLSASVNKDNENFLHEEKTLTSVENMESIAVSGETQESEVMTETVKMQDKEAKTEQETETASDNKIAVVEIPTPPTPEKENEIYVAVEKAPEFPGGTDEMMKWLGMNVRYPEEAYKNNIQGRVVVKFVVNSNGKVSNPVIIRGVSTEIDKEALRVVSAMPDWLPGESGGKKVASYFTIPITFKLVNNNKNQDKKD